MKEKYIKHAIYEKEVLQLLRSQYVVNLHYCFKVHIIYYYQISIKYRHKLYCKQMLLHVKYYCKASLWFLSVH